MRLRCLFLRHRPMLNSIIVRGDRFTAMCDRCGAPIERDKHRRWVDSASLASNPGEAA